MIYCNGNNIIQSGDTLRFWAFVTDVNGGCLSNQDVVFYTVKDGVKTQIGSPVVTDSNGIAVCDYVGSGMGDIAIMAETEIDGTFVSEIYDVLDVMKIYSTIADYYQSSSADLSLTDGVFSKTDGNVMPLNPSTSTRYFTTPMTFEFDVVNTDTLVLQVGESSNVFNQRLSTMGATNGSRIKIVYTGTEVIPYVDGVEQTNYKVSFTHTTQYYLNMYQSGSWKNFVMY